MRQTFKTVGKRHCDVCGREIAPSKSERPSAYARRTKCSHACVVRARQQKAWEQRPQRTCPICGGSYRSSTPTRYNATCGSDECKRRYKTEIAAVAQAATIREQYASGRKAARGISPREVVLWPLLQDHGWQWRTRWFDAWGCFELDFAHPDAKINVELDGPEHSHPKRKARDADRDAELGRRGWRVVRISNEAVDASPDATAELILSLAS